MSRLGYAPGAIAVAAAPDACGRCTGDRLSLRWATFGIGMSYVEKGSRRGDISAASSPAVGWREIGDRLNLRGDEGGIEAA